ncbi:MAG: sigma-54-dependent Fis family transcriptional regulator [Candidatus Eisenbacteria bacterium]|nr:sigma-54-dependent Fis family transcriptional regulator [Candidatus Eisenbacteria bacterium]
MEKILIIEDDADLAETCRRLFRRAGYDAQAVYDGGEGLERLAADPDLSIILTDLRMPGMDGTEVLQRAKQIRPEVDVVIMTGYGTIQNAIQAMKIGATDYITKPFDRHELLRVVSQILEARSLRREVGRLREELRSTFGFANLIGRCPAMLRVFSQIQAACSHESSVLIVGETGTGKELVARAIHYNGARRDRAFVPVNCGAIPRDLIENELFGHARGAFTGATSETIGLFRAADRGTLFLDELAEMPLETQSKLLRVLEDRRIRRVGETGETEIDVRFLAAMGLTPDEAIGKGKLRGDLFFRVGVITIELPPLRERGEDLALLTQHFLEKFNRVFPRRIDAVAPAAMDLLAAYEWPGNVRELEHVIEALFAMGTSERIEAEQLPARVRSAGSRTGGTAVGPSTPAAPEAARQMEVPDTLSDAEQRAIQDALRVAKGNKSRAAALLGISRTRLYKKIRDYGLADDEVPE